jgi:hypothetical protein
MRRLVEKLGQNPECRVPLEGPSARYQRVTFDWGAST